MYYSRLILRWLLGSLTVLVSGWLHAAPLALPDGIAPPPFSEDRIVVAFKPGTPADSRRAAHAANNAIAIERLDAIGVDIVAIPAGTVTEKLAAYARNPNVRYAEPNYLRALILPDEGVDPPPPTGLGIDYFVEQWGLHNTGQSFAYDPNTGLPGAISGTPDADIDAPEAWDITQGSTAVKVAILDSGVDCTHPDLDEKCVENLLMTTLSPVIEDIVGHGTMVAGIAAAETDNNLGVAGVGWSTAFGSLKVCYEYPSVSFPLLALCDNAASAAAMIHAADNGYQVVNMSYGGPEISQAERDAATYALANGVLLIAAAGNAYSTTPSYPAALPEVMAVAATDWFDNLASFSNFDPSWVSIAAPGVESFSTYPQALCPVLDPNGCYNWASGTSFSSPYVAGAAALVFSHQGATATPQSVRGALEAGADKMGVWGQNMLAWTSHGRLNVASALTGAPPPPPPPTGSIHIGDLDGNRVNQGSSWRADVEVLVHDDADGPLAAVTVEGAWSNDALAVSCVTNATGRCILSSSSVSKKTPSITFTVTNVIGTTLNYSATSNHDPDSDSDGTVITVRK